MAKFFLLLEKNDGNKRRKFSSFPFSNFEKTEYSTVFSDLSLNFSRLSPILLDANKTPSGVFKIAREEK